MLQVWTSVLTLCGYFSFTEAQCIPGSLSNQGLFWVNGYRRFEGIYSLHLHGPLKMREIRYFESDLEHRSASGVFICHPHALHAGYPRPITAVWMFPPPLYLRSRMRVVPTCNRCTTVGGGDSQPTSSQCCSDRCQWVLQGAMGYAALLVALMTVAGVRGQDGESIATSFLTGQLFQ